MAFVLYLIAIRFEGTIDINTVLLATIPIIGTIITWKLNQVHKIINSAADALKLENAVKVKALEDTVSVLKAETATAQQGQAVAETKLEMTPSPPAEPK